MRVLTFDIEDWFHLLDAESSADQQRWGDFQSRLQGNTDRILEELDRRHCPATFFALGWVAARHPEVIRKIAGMGHRIGTHSYGHELIGRQSPEAFDTDLAKSIDAITDVTGLAVRHYRAPGFSLTPDRGWVFESLTKRGIEVDSSIFASPHAHGGYAGLCDRPSWIDFGVGRIKEFPVVPGRVLGRSMAFSGGGYFRLLPYRTIRREIGRNDYVMTYFHPRDFDAAQPVLPGLPLNRRFKAYVGLAGAFSKLRKMLDEYEFVDLDTAEAMVDWSTAGVAGLEPNASPTADPAWGSPSLGSAGAVGSHAGSESGQDRASAAPAIVPPRRDAAELPDRDGRGRVDG